MSGRQPLSGVHEQPAYNMQAVCTVGMSAARNEHLSAPQLCCCRLLANVYAVQVTHLTTGMRIGSAAAEKLNLFKLGALNFYRSYPEGQAEPLQQLMQIVNEAGKGLTPEQQEAVMEELPAAFPKISLLLMPLART